MNNRQKLVQKRFLNNEKAVIQRLEQIYAQSQQELEERIKGLSFKIGELQKQYDWLEPDDPDREKIKSMIQSKIYQKSYQEQLKSQVDGILDQMQRRSYLTVSDYLDECYTDGFIGTIFDLHGQGIPIISPIDQRSLVRAVQLDSKINHGLYTKLGEDVGLLKKKIAAHVSRAIATGMTYAQTAQQLAGCTSIGFNNAVRIARTEGHRVQTTATMDAMTEAKKKGASVVKQWDATLDARTRDSHAKVDGEVRELDEPFSNGLMFPGDPNGDAAEVINCRCALLQRAKWALDADELKTLQDRAEFFELDKKDEFESFKRQYMKATEAPKVDPFHFTDEQKEAIEWYVSGEGQFVNQYYRGRVGGDFGELSDFERELSSLLDVATDRSLPTDIERLYRSVDASAIFGDIDAIDFDNLRQILEYGDGVFGKGAYAESIKRQTTDILTKTKGKTITEKGFMSTSKDYGVVADWGSFTGAEKPLVIEFVDIPKGVKGADLKMFDVEGAEQHEVLLARNTKYKILDIFARDGQIHVKAKFIV